MPTDLAMEQAEQRRWRLRPSRAAVRWFDAMVVGEFLPAEDQLARQGAALARLARFAAAHVPFYRDLFQRLKLAPDSLRRPEALRALPVLTKRDVQEHFDRLRAPLLPRGHRIAGEVRSSGTTGRPTRILHTARSRLLFVLAKQRELRWFRFDPAGRFAAIRLSNQLPPGPDGRPLADGVSGSAPAWPLVGAFFQTGPFFYFSVTNPIEEHWAWLERHRPNYLLSYSETLEYLARVRGEGGGLDELKGLLAISEQLTPDMRRTIQKVFAVPLHQNYGLNEVGLVASRCPEGGRYHVHAEHCLVELVDEGGRPCAPGEVGKVLVTNLTNLAMPLVRYDTDDLAEAVEGPCPCGRTLPSFGRVVGRYSRIAFLPKGTLDYVAAVREALEQMPPGLSRHLRRFQVHQYRDGSFELRLVATAPLPGAFVKRVQAAWQAAARSGPPAPLRLVRVERIERSPGGKFQDFTSEFVPAPDLEGSGRGADKRD